ncbi:Hypothetical protein SMAX5B_011380 [Scophthalmus maximus]|uniref:Uncharacterized protein n=1 Tax=Scophthalmus maximus TaxID=52904 RepID=A0A2U9BMH6_SCOMX|nr:Hypothetical protein SMAX5B_011380 [Scophthalmus maximus]
MGQNTPLTVKNPRRHLRPWDSQEQQGIREIWESIGGREAKICVGVGCERRMGKLDYGAPVTPVSDSRGWVCRRKGNINARCRPVNLPDELQTVRSAAGVMLLH